MYHYYRKDSSYVRSAIFRVYKGQCAFCGTNIEPRYMHVDHILPTNKPEALSEEIKKYIQELENDGFIQDSIENYLPSCSSCNLKKNNQVFQESNLRFYHEIARKHTKRVLLEIDKAKKNREFFYEPVDLSIWDVLTFSYQRDISHAIMGYRLTCSDVDTCPVFPQVDKIKKQLEMVDYATIQGETGCGKSISLFQVARGFFNDGWKVYLLKPGFHESMLKLPDNTENSLYLIDDAQIVPDSMIEQLASQSQRNRKVLFAKTIAENISSDSIVLTNKEAVEILYKDYLNRKQEILPIVQCCDKTVGTGLSDIPYEKRLEEAKKANTPWQFSYILRGGWKSIKDIYGSICNHKDCDLLAATIAAFQILQLDKAIDFRDLCNMIQSINQKYKWDDADLDFLVKRRIVLSNDDVRIVHLESANIIVALFFEQDKNEKQMILLKLVENAFANKEISPLGIVWLCNGSGRYMYRAMHSDSFFITDKVIETVFKLIYEQQSSEEIRNTFFLLEKILVSNRKEEGFNFLKTNKDRIIALMNNADSISSLGFSILINSIYNYDHKFYLQLSKQVSWMKLMDRMMRENNPDYYAWGKLFNRGLSLLGPTQYCVYSDKMYAVTEWVLSKAQVNNIEKITYFLCQVSFLNPVRIHSLIPSVIPIYEQFLNSDLRRAIYLFDYDFMLYICGIGILEKRKPMEQQKKTAKLFVDIIPEGKMADTISNSSIHEWLAIRDIMYFIYCFDIKKYKYIVKQINLEQLSEMSEDSWGHSYETSMIVSILATADKSIAKEYLKKNKDRIVTFFPEMVSVAPDLAVEMNKTQGVKLELLTGHHWEDSLSALQSLAKYDGKYCIKYLNSNKKAISNIYSDVRALDFTDNSSLDFLKEIEKMDKKTYAEVISNIDKKRIENNWDKCGGISKRKVQWVKKRKKEFFKMLGLTE